MVLSGQRVIDIIAAERSAAIISMVVATSCRIEDKIVHGINWRPTTSAIHDTSIYTEKPPEASSEHCNSKNIPARKLITQKSPEMVL